MIDQLLKKLFQSAVQSTDRGRLEDAVVALRTALLAQPDYRPALHSLTVALVRLDRIAEAEAVLKTALERYPAAPELHALHAEILAQWGRMDEAIRAAETAFSNTRGDPGVLTLLASLREQAGEAGLAQASLQAAVASPIPDAAALTALGRMQRQSGDVTTALETLAKAVACPSTPQTHASAHVQHALALLADGQVAEGFREYDWRWKTGQLPGLDPGLPPWDGSKLGGRVLLVRCEQGMSECLQFFRLAGMITGGRVVVEAPAALVAILRASHRVSEVIAQGDALPDADCWAPLLSLPRLLKIEADTIPDEVPYLRSDPSLLSEWRDLLGPGPKIGIAWQGGDALFDNRQRAVPLADFAPLATVPGTRLLSLQKGEGRRDVDHVPFPINDLTDQMDEGEGAFVDTAVVMQHCALIVTTDTAIAHLAGALARPCWVVLPEGGDWRFGWHATHSPWYPTLECLRRPPGGSWRDVFEHIARRLTAIRTGQVEEESPVGGHLPGDDAPNADPENLPVSDRLPGEAD